MERGDDAKHLYEGAQMHTLFCNVRLVIGVVTSAASRMTEQEDSVTML